MPKTMQQLSECRKEIRKHYLADETQIIKRLTNEANLTIESRTQISLLAAKLIKSLRSDSSPTVMEEFLAEYGLSTKEGIALMCLAEALLRVPDKVTIDELIKDKVVPGCWSDHRGQSSSALINSSTWALLLTGKMLAPSDQNSLTQTLHSLIKRLGEPVVRIAVAQVMKEMGNQFVLGRNIDEALSRAKKYQSQGYTYSYDMLGEAARTEADAVRYHQAYTRAIEQLSHDCTHKDLRDNPGISIKLSALHARYEFGQKDRVTNELIPRTLELAKLAKAANMGFNIDAEEADRLDLSLDVIEAVLSDTSLQGGDGFGVVVQAFGQRASFVLDWLYALAKKLDRKIMVRLVKGAYWDAEIKRAQVMGLEGFPVFTRKVNSDISYIACAKKLRAMTDRIYPQFATHNAHSAAAVLELFKEHDYFEFQRLHGMGESLHDTIISKHSARCRIYAPVGAHQDLLAYLVRRLLENGANSSFVNQIVDDSIQPEEIARDPFLAVEEQPDNLASKVINQPSAIYGASRLNAKGWDITDTLEVNEIEKGRMSFKDCQWAGRPILAGEVSGSDAVDIYNPANPRDLVGTVSNATEQDVQTAITSAQSGFKKWAVVPVGERSKIIRRVADLFENNAHELFALATREAGKNLIDGIAEIREAVDFARYYANEAERLENAGNARGVIACISPWNFPLAIFAGQILAALAAGNTVLAKPAEQTVLMATRAVELMHEAGIPQDAIQLLPGSGPIVGAALTSDARISGVCFTGSTTTAQVINRAMATSMAADAPLIAETGGLNAMIVDSTALPEQVVRDVLASAFQSAGQRCSALRVLYLQEDVATSIMEMLMGAMDELRVGDPWLLSTDIGPVIDSKAKQKIDAHCETFKQQGRLLKQLSISEEGTFAAPTVIKLNHIEELKEEIFGPVLHVITFKADEIIEVVDQINAKGYGLTFGIHTRVDNRVSQIVERIKAGNIYVNRNQIGAIVGSQPFGGEGLSGTGPKAGGPQYVRRFIKAKQAANKTLAAAATVSAIELQDAIDSLKSSTWGTAKSRTKRLTPVFGDIPAPLDAQTTEMPGPTGETNTLSNHPRGIVLCLGPNKTAAFEQARVALSKGNAVVIISSGARDLLSEIDCLAIPATAIDGLLIPESLVSVRHFAAIASAADEATLKSYRIALSRREGAILPLITEIHEPERFVIERHLCVDTTAAGGNASLIASSE